MKTPHCPNGHGTMTLQTVKNRVTFRGVDIEIDAPAYVCPTCGLEAGSVEMAGNVQRKIADAYRRKMNLMTGDEIRSLRQARNSTQAQLADVMNVGVASIKRWEAGAVQSKSMDRALRMQLQWKVDGNNYSGNREISLERVKRVARRFEAILGKRLLKPNDKMLYLAKYEWYADMLAFRRLGRSMTGATYSALPRGPQLNNYNHLVKLIIDADESGAEPLSEEEERIIAEIASRFPTPKAVYDAAHREPTWSTARTGALISYDRAHELTEI